MNITWAGLACFKIEGQSATLVIDPFDPSAAGIKMAAKKADIVLSSFDNKLHGNIKEVKGRDSSPIIISTPGEYESKEVFIYGISIKAEKAKTSPEVTIFRFTIDGVNIVHLGALKEPLANSQLEHLEKTDIIFVPVGGSDYLNATQAAALCSQISPKMIIPMCYKTPGVKIQLDSVEKFYKEIGIEPQEIEAKIKITKKDLAGQSEQQLKVLTPE